MPFQDLVQSTVLGVTVHLDGVVIYANRAAEEMLGRHRGGLLGRSSLGLLPPEEVGPVRARVRALLEDGTPAGSFETRLERPDGGDVVLESVAELVRVGGRPAVSVFSCDVTERSRREAELAHAATHDALTDLPNRTLLLDRLEQSLSRLGRSCAAVLVVFCDLDGFKGVNDTYGHGAGDAVLRQVAARLRRCLGPADTVARLSGDEFVVCAELADPAEGAAVRGRLEEALAAPLDVGEEDVVLGASLGVLRVEQATDPLRVLAEADQLMYREKSAHRRR